VVGRASKAEGVEAVGEALTAALEEDTQRVDLLEPDARPSSIIFSTTRQR